VSEATTIKYCSIGGVEGIGASAHYLLLDRWGVLLDAGYDPHLSGQEALPNYALLKDRPVNAIVVSHAHLDHIGSLPVAIRNFPRARVYMTSATVELADQLLFHYLQVQRNKESARYEPLYTEEYLESIHFLYQGFRYQRPFPLHGYEDSGLQFAFYDAGHILGSAGILIEWRGKRIFYTGNTRKSAQFILRGARYPVESIDLLITEATYGANAEAEKVRRLAEVKRFAQQIAERLRMGGIVLLPVFALGRTQEMLTLIHTLRIKNRIPVAPVYITGMGLKINRTYDRLLHKIYPEFNNRSLRAMTFGRWRIGSKQKAPAILLATSGMMLPGTASFEFAQSLAANPRNAIYFVGYADPDTPGGLFREKKYNELKNLFDLEKIACQVEVFQFSAHSNRRELLAMIKQLKPKNVIFVHGEQAALEWMRTHTKQIFPSCTTLIPQKGEWYDILG
jgi:Cft2 family RNA processing exonuclease